MSVYSHRDKPAYRMEGLGRGISPEHPPIMTWWTPAHDDEILKAIQKHEWHWYWYIKDRLISITDKSVLEHWKNTDPLCQKWVWYNTILYFSYSRAEKLGFTRLVRSPTVRRCELCDLSFTEDSLPASLVARVGVDRIRFCAPCLSECLLQEGDKAASGDQIRAYLHRLTDVMSRIPPSDFGKNIEDILDMTDGERLAVLQILRGRPDVGRVKELFGSWLHALIESGVLANDVRRTARGIQCLANDGHVCLSLGEKTIDDLLHSLGIEHEKEPRYPEGNFRADFKIEGAFIEYFGLAGEKSYDQRIILKKEICRRYSINLISLYARDLSSVTSLKAKIFRQSHPHNQADGNG